MAGPGSGTGFQTFVNKEPAVAVAGDFAGANIKANVVAGQWKYVASPGTLYGGGVVIGVGAWANPATTYISTYYQPSSFPCFIHREAQGLVTVYLGISTMLVEGGDMITGYDQGDFWGIFSAGGTAGQKVYFDPLYGTLTANAAGNSVGGAITSASITSSVLTVATITGTPLAVGQIIGGTGVPVGTYIASLGTGTGGTGTYNLANADGTTIPNVSAEAMTYTGVQESQFYLASQVTADCDFTASLAVPAAGTAFGILTVSAISSGTLAAGQWISATGLPGSANIQILEQLTGTAGSTGTYLTNNVSYTISSTSSFVATMGKLGRISSWAVAGVPA
jgi:hypothetical protein